jgi:hypothetical protein
MRGVDLDELLRRDGRLASDVEPHHRGRPQDDDGQSDPDDAHRPPTRATTVTASPEQALRLDPPPGHGELPGDGDVEALACGLAPLPASTLVSACG